MLMDGVGYDLKICPGCTPDFHWRYITFHESLVPSEAY